MQFDWSVETAEIGGAVVKLKVAQIDQFSKVLSRSRRLPSLSRMRGRPRHGV